jgi:TPR repeat protein
LPGQQDAAATVQNNPAEQAKKPPARQFADEASRAAPSGTSRELKLALARPLAEMPHTAASVPQPPAKHPNAVLPEFVRALVQRGDVLILLGDISGARRLYALAAEDGDGQAAKRLGDTYNPEFLSDHHVQGLQPDINAAEEWYRKAAALGDPDASETLRYSSSSRR